MLKIIEWWVLQFLSCVKSEYKQRDIKEKNRYRYIFIQII